MYFKLKKKHISNGLFTNSLAVYGIMWEENLHKLQFKSYLYMPETSIPIKIKLTGIQSLISFQFNFSTETAPKNPNTATTRVLIKFCNEKQPKE